MLRGVNGFKVSETSVGVSLSKMGLRSQCMGLVILRIELDNVALGQCARYACVHQAFQQLLCVSVPLYFASRTVDPPLGVCCVHTGTTMRWLPGAGTD